MHKYFASHSALLEYVDSIFVLNFDFSAAGLHRRLGIPMRGLVNCDYDARLVLSREIDELLDRLQVGRSTAERNDTMQRYLPGKW